MQAELSPVNDPGQVAFFVGRLCQEADLVYRFGYALTLSELGAGKLVTETYTQLVGRLDPLLESDSQDLRSELLRVAWDIFQTWTEAFKETDTELLDLLHSISVEVRAVLILIDALGFSPSEAAKILDLKDIELRRYLGEGRKQLLSFES